MAALPNVTTAVAGAATEGDVKNHLSGVYAFLAGLFGTTGAAADARTALGVTPLTSGNVATALGYTPANLASAGSDHNHTGTYAPMTAFVSGTYYTTLLPVPGIRFTQANGATVDVPIWLG